MIISEPDAFRYCCSNKVVRMQQHRTTEFIPKEMANMPLLQAVRIAVFCFLLLPIVVACSMECDTSDYVETVPEIEFIERGMRGILGNDDAIRFIDAVRRRDMSEVRNLSQRVDIRGLASRAFREAALNNDPAMVKLLVELGADVNAMEGGSTALHWVAQLSPPAVQLLIDHGANVNARTADFEVIWRDKIIEGPPKMIYVGHEFGRTPFMFAARHRNWEVARILISAGANVNAKNCDGKTALHLASRPADAVIVENLLTFGADPNTQAEDGTTPLLAAVVDGSLHVVQLLLRAGADTQVRSADGSTALSVAQQLGHNTIVDVLKDHSGKK